MNTVVANEVMPLSKAEIDLLVLLSKGPRATTNPTPKDALALVRRGFARLDRRTATLTITALGRRWLNATP